MDNDTKKWWKEDLDLVEVYSLNELPKRLCLRYMKQIGIPTEMVIKDEQVVTPIQARYWEVDRWLVDGKVVDYDYLVNLKDFKGSYHHTTLYIIELWGDYGDDGHTEPSLEGYGLTADIERAKKHLRKEQYNDYKN